MKNLFRWIPNLFGRRPQGGLTYKTIRVGDKIEYRRYYDTLKELSEYSHEAEVTKVDKRVGCICVKQLLYTTSSGFELFETKFLDYDKYKFTLIRRDYDPKQQPYDKDDI